MTHVMVDIETLGTVPGSVILSIGAVVFDVEKGLGSEFYAAIYQQDCERRGLTVDPLTEQWWEAQSEEARESAFVGPLFGDRMPADPRLSLRQALSGLDRFWRDNGATHLWGYGASFDGPLLEAAYRVVGWKAPWPYNASRCARTLYKLADINTRDFASGTYHNALDDARTQALAAVAAFKKLNLLPA